jgi:quinolinate synthase
MKKITLRKLRDCLIYGTGEISLEESVSKKAFSALARMMEIK